MSHPPIPVLDPQTGAPASQVRSCRVPLPSCLQEATANYSVPGWLWVVRAHFCCAQRGQAEEMAGKQIGTSGPFPLTRTAQGK